MVITAEVSERAVKSKSLWDHFTKTHSAMGCSLYPDGNPGVCMLGLHPHDESPSPGASLTQNSLHLLTSLDFADEAPLE